MKKIKLFDPYITKEEEKTLINVLKSKFWASGAGVGHVLKFENEFRKFVDSDACIAVNSGTAALNLALSLMDIKDKEVILPSLSFVSTANAVLLNDAKPIFVDIEPETLCINPNLIKKSITKKTKVILPVHFAGFPCKLDEIINICKENQLILVEDAAHAAGASYKNKKIGKHGMAVCFSFHPVKNLAMPTGGLISINHNDHKMLEYILHSRRWCGITNRQDVFYDVQETGWNYYMNEFSAAIGIAQLKKLGKMNRIRSQIAKTYDKEIQIKKKIPFSLDCSYHIYWIFVNERDKFRKKMLEAGIETGIHYRPIHFMSLYQNKTKLPVTEEAGNHIVSIPIHPNLCDSDIDKIIHYVNKFS